jgi:D-alanyl-lipoteichoic acid acyltransferase DltB (MBOAT superfamily)
VISGPIHRFFTVRREDPRDSFGAQLRQANGGPTFSADNFRHGCWRILTGVIKKFVIADFFFRLAEPVMQPGQLLTAPLWQIWLAGHAYFVYLYIEFSGYTDIAWAFPLFGYRVMENFNWPLLAPNLQEFWRRWHMSLTYWLTNYIYIPLGGGRKSGSGWT